MLVIYKHCILWKRFIRNDVRTARISLTFLKLYLSQLNTYLQFPKNAFRLQGGVACTMKRN